MGLEFLARVRRSSLIAGLVVALAIAAVAPWKLAAGFTAGLLWSLVNLLLLQFIVVTMTGAERGTPVALTRLGLGFAGSLALFGAGAFLLFQLPTLALAAGFTFPFLVLTLKAASMALLESALWRRLTASRWQSALVLLLLVGGIWFGVDHFRTAPRAIAQGTESTQPEKPAAEATADHAGAGTPEGKKPEGPKEFSNLIGIIAEGAIHKAEETHTEVPAWAKFLEHFEVIIYSLFVALLISVVSISVANNWKMIPGPLQALLETWVEHAYNFFTGILGPKYGPQLVPFLGTLFVYIYVMNIFGLIPFMHSPTSNLNVTVAMALTVFVYVQFMAFKELGLLGWLDHMAGSPRDVVGWALVPLMMPVHLIGEIAKPISLSCRLFGNIFGEDMLLVGFATLGVTALSALHLPFGLPLHVPFMFLAGIITAPVQALVFTMLSTIYFLLMLPHDDHGHGEHAEEAHHHAH